MTKTFFVSVAFGVGAMVAVVAPSSAWAAQPSATTQDLEARLKEQDERIRQLEEQVSRLTAGAAPADSQNAEIEGSTSDSDPAQTAVDAADNREEVTIKLRGRIQLDASLGSGDDMSFGTQVRRFYLGAEGKLGGGFRYLAEADFAGNDVNLQDVFIGYSMNPGTELVLGYFKPSITNDDLTSDVHTLFLERSAYASIFAPGRRIGAGLHHNARNWGVRAGLFGEREDRALDTDRSEAWLASGRVHADLLPGADVLHVALSGYYTEPSSSDGTVRISQKPEVNRAPTVLDTGLFLADRGVFGGAELGYAHGPFNLQVEGGALGYDGGTNEPLFWGLSAQAAWRWTGEGRPYDIATGTFGRVTPSRSLADGGIGAFETGLRFTHVDLDDAGVLGGRLTTYGLVLNWFPVTRVRVSGNYIHAEVEHLIDLDRDYDLFVVRGAVDW